MAAGARDQLVTIQASTSTQSVGEPVRTWAQHAKWWAEKRPLGGSEGRAVGQEQFGILRWEWRGLYVAGVQAKMRLLEADGTEHDIDTPTPDYRRNSLVLVTTQRGT